ncbi:uncharacterized protein [Littorina saxatilis]|uniref:uncharacterized protein isoform X2 n=1 Tax=Littorina saxatilis TaxID=31220 RepID=UPI0038B4CE22
MDVSSNQQSISAEDLMQCIVYCRDLEQKIIQFAKPASELVQNWPEDIRTNSTTKRNAFLNNSMIQPPALLFGNLVQDLDGNMNMVLDLLDKVLVGLDGHMRQWKLQQLHETMGRTCAGGPTDTAYVEKMCEEICGCVSALLGFAMGRDLQQVNYMKMRMTAGQSLTVSPIVGRLEAILDKIFKECLVVMEQPELSMVTVKVKGEDEEPNRNRKFRMVVGLLGGKGFGDNIMINDVDVYLAYNQDIAEAQAHDRKPQRNFKLDLEEVSRDGDPGSSLRVGFEKAYEYSAVENFSRINISVPVYKQLYHVVFDANIHVGQLMKDFRGQAVSLPVMVRTAANQASEQVGALLWHSCSAKDVYNLRSAVAESMRVDDVVEMINERISLPKGRRLRREEREFLQERIRMAENGRTQRRPREPSSSITLNNLIKGKIILQGTSLGENDKLNFPLWRWLHSIINLVHDTVKGPWKDGIIAGLLSRKQCETALADRSIRDGTFLLRFSESQVTGNHLNCKGALVIVVKLRGRAAFVPPIEADTIENSGLGEMVEIEGANVCKVLLGKNVTVSDVKKEYPRQPTKRVNSMERYKKFCLDVESDQQEPQAENHRPGQEGSASSPNIPLTVPAELTTNQHGGEQFPTTERAQDDNMDEAKDQDQTLAQQAAVTNQVPWPDHTMNTQPHPLDQLHDVSLAAPGVCTGSPGISTTFQNAVSPNSAMSSTHDISFTAQATMSPGGVGMGSPDISTPSSITSSHLPTPDSMSSPGIFPAYPNVAGLPDDRSPFLTFPDQAMASFGDGSGTPMSFSAPSDPSGMSGCPQGLLNTAAPNPLMGLGDPIMSAACGAQSPMPHFGEEEFIPFDSGDLDSHLYI